MINASRMLLVGGGQSKRSAAPSKVSTRPVQDCPLEHSQRGSHSVTSQERLSDKSIVVLAHGSQCFLARCALPDSFLARNTDNELLSTQRWRTMPDRSKGGIIFIRDDTTLPPSLSVTTDAFLPNWRIVISPDRSTLARSIEGCTWYFFYLAGNIQATVLGGNTLEDAHPPYRKTRIVDFLADEMGKACALKRAMS